MQNFTQFNFNKSKVFSKTFLFSLTIFLFLTHILIAQKFNLDGKLYFFRNVSGTDYLSYFDNYPATITIADLCPIDITSYNALGANPKNQYLYFLDSNVLKKLTNTCVKTPVCTLASKSYTGCFDDNGRLIIQ